jgi:two-component system chemotaxis response regulator CheY
LIGNARGIASADGQPSAGPPGEMWKNMSKAMVVDDSRTIRMILRRILTEIGFDVCEAGDGVEALQIIEANKPNVTLVLADWNMPTMNGFDLLKQLRLNPEYASLKIVMVTTEAEVGHMASALHAGANEYVMKPFTKEILVQKLEMIGITSPASV